MNNDSMPSRIKMITRHLFALFVLLTLSACAPIDADDSQIMYVGNKLVDCTGVAPQKCMLVKTKVSDDWEYFYDQISGFQYQIGYSYTLLVKLKPVENPAQDASSIAYELIELIEKNCTSC